VWFRTRIVPTWLKKVSNNNINLKFAGLLAAENEKPGLISKPIFIALFGTMLNQKEPSPSTKPVTYQGSSSELLLFDESVELLFLLVILLFVININPIE
jgi:hypothetical protein